MASSSLLIHLKTLIKSNAKKMQSVLVTIPALSECSQFSYKPFELLTLQLGQVHYRFKVDYTYNSTASSIKNGILGKSYLWRCTITFSIPSARISDLSLASLPAWKPLQIYLQLHVYYANFFVYIVQKWNETDCLTGTLAQKMQPFLQ